MKKITNSEHLKKIRGDKSEQVCKYNNTGFCKYADKCKYFHEQSLCDLRPCMLGQPQLCKYREKWRRKSSCLYYHESLVQKANWKKRSKKTKNEK